MGACASKFTVLKNASTAPPPAVKHEVESREVNRVEELAVKKDDAASVEDEASRRQSLGHLLSEVKSSEEKKGSTVADEDKTEEAANADGIKSKGLEEAILPCQNVGMEAETVKLESEGEVETLKTEKPEENKAVEIPETVETKVRAEKVEEKPAQVTQCETSEKAPEAPATEKIDVEKPTSDAEKKEADEKLTDSSVIGTPEKEPEVTEEQKPTSEAEKKNAEEKLIETSDKKPESPEIEKTEHKEAADTEKNETEEKPTENTKVVVPDEVEDKHVLEPQQAENCAGDNTSSEELKPAAEQPKA